MGSRARLEVVPLLNFQSTVCVSRALPLSFRCCCSPVFPHDYSVNSSRASSRSDTCLISHTWACLGLPPANLCLNKMRDPKNKFGCKEDGGGGFVWRFSRGTKIDLNNTCLKQTLFLTSVVSMYPSCGENASIFFRIAAAPWCMSWADCDGGGLTPVASVETGLGQNKGRRGQWLSHWQAVHRTTPVRACISVTSFGMNFIAFVKYLFSLHLGCTSMSSVYSCINILVFSYLFVGSLYEVIAICYCICWKHLSSGLGFYKYSSLHWKHKETLREWYMKHLEPISSFFR